MLNYLSVLTQEINNSENSRLFIEEAYSSLINNTYPNAVDSRTQNQLNGLLDTLEEYRMISVKRERLQYIYEQNQAQALKSAIPNPIGLLSSTQSVSLPQLVLAVVYMAVDSVVSYKSALNTNYMDFLQSGWELDDEAAETLHYSRKEAFNYLLDIVREYNLPGELALNESSVQDYVENKNSDNIAQKIQFFESKQKVYEAYGDYWLALASAYYQNGDYAKCIECVDHYLSMNAHIFREDHELAKTLPLAIVSAEKVLPQNESIKKIEEWLKILLENTNEKNWALRYFAAQMYFDLYKKNEKKDYLKNAYDIVLDNVNYLVNEQREKNEEYLSNIKTIEVPKNETKSVQNEIKKYNEMLKKERETALPPVYEPFYINIDLLFELSEKLELSQADRKRINGILHPNDEPVFLIDLLDSKYWIDTDEGEYSYGTDLKYQSFYIDCDGDDLTIPAFLVSDDAIITVSVEDDESIVFDDWKITNVERANEYENFKAHFHSSKAQNYKHNLNEIIRIEIIPKKNNVDKKYVFNMEAIKLHESPISLPYFSELNSVTYRVIS